MAKVNRKKEELYNVVTHAAGMLLAVIAIVLMLIYSITKGNTLILISTLVFGLSMLALYSASTFYHAAYTLSKKRIWKKMDHLSIYLLIAGTYTPFALVGLQGAWGWSIFGIIWTLVVVGFLFKYSPWRYNKKISVSIYVLMGWICVIAVKPMIENLSSGALIFLLLGGLFYTSGVYFYAKDDKPYFHPIWHLFVLGGSTMHFLSVYLFILP